MKQVIGLICLVLALTYSLEASIFGNGRGARAIALGNAFVAIADDPWAPYYNSGGLGRIDRAMAAAFFSPQQFGMNELRTIALGGTLPLNIGTVGVNVHQFGFELYKENGVSIGFGREIDWDVYGGITIHINRFVVERYGSTTKALLDIGLFSEPLRNLTLGFAAHNILGTTIGATNEHLPRIFKIGTAYVPLRAFTVLFELEKDIRHPLSMKAGVEQKFLDFFAIRLGTTSNPDTFSGGIGLEYSLFTFGYAGNLHKELGWTHQIELAIRLKD